MTTHLQEMIARAAELNQSGDYDQALAIVQRAAEISESMDLSDALQLLYQQMCALISLENFEGALETFRQAEQLVGDQQNEAHFAPLLLACGDLCEAAGEPEAAISMYQRVLRIVRDVPAERVNNPENVAVLNIYMAQAMNGLGLAHFHAGRQTEAVVWLEKSIEVFSETLGPDDEETLAVRENLIAVLAEG